MSHITTINIKIKDLDSLKEACEELGLVFYENKKTYKWYGRSVGDYPLPEGMTVDDLGKCDHAIGLKNNKEAYEIGLVKRGDEYIPVWDFWSGGFGLEKAVGKDCINLTDSYSKFAAIRSVKKRARAGGYTFQQEWDSEANETVLRLRKY